MVSCISSYGNAVLHNEFSVFKTGILTVLHVRGLGFFFKIHVFVHLVNVN